MDPECRRHQMGKPRAGGQHGSQRPRGCAGRQARGSPRKMPGPPHTALPPQGTPHPVSSEAAEPTGGGRRGNAVTPGLMSKPWGSWGQPAVPGALRSAMLGLLACRDQGLNQREGQTPGSHASTSLGPHVTYPTLLRPPRLAAHSLPGTPHRSPPARQSAHTWSTHRGSRFRSCGSG